MSDPNLHWDGEKWLRWDGSDWVADPSLPPPSEEPTTAPSAPQGNSKIIFVVLAVVVAVALIAGAGVFLLGKRGDDQPAARPTPSPTSSSSTIVTMPMNAAQDSFTDNVGRNLTFTPKTTSSPESVPGGQPGLYGGTRDESSCDREKLISYLMANPDKARAWAGVLGIQDSRIPAYVRGLTPALLRRDTYVINHGYVNGQATSFPSVLQAGTAVLLGKYGLPVVRCYCGNPLTQPSGSVSNVTFTGTTWPGWDPRSITLVTQNTIVLIDIILIDVNTGERFVRPVGTDGISDRSPGQSTGGTTPQPSASGSTPGEYPSDYPTQYPQDEYPPHDEYPQDEATTYTDDSEDLGG